MFLLRTGTFAADQKAKQSAYLSRFLPFAFWFLFPTGVFQVQNGLHSEKCPKENSLNAFAVLGAVNLPGMPCGMFLIPL